MLDGSHQRLALGDRETKVLRPLRLLVEHRNFRGTTHGSVFGSDLKKNLHAHDEPPLLIAGKRAFHKTRSGKLKATPGSLAPGYCGPYELLKANGLHSGRCEANWAMASVNRVAAAVAAILVREGVDYARSKAVFKAVRERAGLRASPEHRGNVDRLTVEEELRFLDQAYSRDGRTGLMLQTLLETGARASELVQLRVEDVSLVERVITIRQGKGGKRGRCRSGVTWRSYCGCISARNGRDRCSPAVRKVLGQCPMF